MRNLIHFSNNSHALNERYSIQLDQNLGFGQSSYILTFIRGFLFSFKTLHFFEITLEFHSDGLQGLYYRNFS